MTSRSFKAWLIGLVILKGFTAEARVYYPFGADDSIELLAADSDVIVRAKLISTKEITGKQRGFEVVTIKITETIKGTIAGTLTVVNAGRNRLGDDCLIFLVSTPGRFATTDLTPGQLKELEGCPFTIRDCWDNPIPLGTNPQRRASYNSRFEHFQTSDALLAAIREEVRNPPKPTVGTLELQVSATSTFFAPEAGERFGQRYLNVMIEPRLAARAGMDQILG